jgi:hypothetical protein
VDARDDRAGSRLRGAGPLGPVPLDGLGLGEAVLGGLVGDRLRRLRHSRRPDTSPRRARAVPKEPAVCMSSKTATGPACFNNVDFIQVDFGRALRALALLQITVGEGKLRLLFDFMGRMVPIDVDQRDVFAIATVRKRKRRRRGRKHRKAH